MTKVITSQTRLARMFGGSLDTQFRSSFHLVHKMPVRILGIQPYCNASDGRSGSLVRVGNWERTGTVIAYDSGDLHEYTGTTLVINDCIQGSFCWTMGDGTRAALINGQVVPAEKLGPMLIPRNWAVSPGDLATLVTLVDNLQTPVLKAFLNQLFSDPHLARTFMNIPASREYHHAFPGGNLRHSLVVAFGAVGLLATHSQEEYDLMLCAGLLHDIGRVEVYDIRGNYKPLGRLKHHDALTAEVLSAPMKVLTEKNEMLANKLRHLLYRSHKDKDYPQSVLYNALKQADGHSALQNQKAQATWDKPTHYQQVRGDDGRSWVR